MEILATQPPGAVNYREKRRLENDEEDIFMGDGSRFVAILGSLRGHKNGR